ncbi:MAG: YheU family protein [Pseudomonadales bacterium]
MIIPYESIAEDTLQNLIEEFVTRDGTDYGEYEQCTAQKVAQVMLQLERGDVVILFIESTQSVNIVAKATLN